MCNCINLYCSNAIDFITRQKAENTDLLFKLNGVMHHVDKWLEGDELEQNEVVRAETMRKKTLQIVERQQAEFAERLGKRLCDIHFQNYELAISEMFDLLKEMTEE